MPTPTMVTIVGTLSPLLQATRIDFEIPESVRHGAGPDVILPHTISIPVASDGTLSEPVYGTNDPAWSPANWTYKVTIRGDNTFEPFYAQVPYNAGTLNFSALLPALTPSEGELYAAFGHTHGGGISLPIDIEDVTDLDVQLASKLDIPIEPYITAADIAGLASEEAMNEGLALKANIASPTFTGTVAGITKSMVGLGNADNTSDANKPVSTAQQTALDLKAPLASPAFTGTPTGITKTHVGLGSVDNTSDVNKPISSAVQAALDLINSRDNLLVTGEEILPRDDVAGEVAMVSGVAYFSFFTARKTETITQVRTATGSTAASGLTVARIAVYSTDGTTLTSVANTVHDGTLWTAANTSYTRSFAASWNKTAGQRYVGCLIAVGTTPPNIEGVNIRPNSAGLAPRIASELTGQSNLPAGPTEASLANTFRRFQAIFLP